MEVFYQEICWQRQEVEMYSVLIPRGMGMDLIARCKHFSDAETVLRNYQDGVITDHKTTLVYKTDGQIRG